MPPGSAGHFDRQNGDLGFCFGCVWPFCKTPGLTLRLILGPVPLLRMERLLLADEFQFLQRASEGRATARDSQLLAQLIERGIGVLSHQFAEAILALEVQGGWVSAPMGLGFERAGLAASAEQARDEGETDTEPAGDLTERSVAGIDRGGDALSEVYGIRFHPAPPLQLVLCLHFTVLAIQQGIALDQQETTLRPRRRNYGFEG